MGLLTVFANFRIDSEERFLRMKDSFYSFSDADIEKWVINVRGSFKDQVSLFLQDKLGNKLRIYTLESEQGWFFDTRQMLPEINSKYVFFWIEDHICVGGVKYFDAIVQEMSNLKVEYLLYSWFLNGKVLENFQRLQSFNGENLVHINYDKSTHKQCISNFKNFYIVSCCSITSLNLFLSIVNANDPILRRWPVKTPFDFEKAPQDIHWLPLKYAIPKNELFASIDDNFNCPGYSLISRGLYPQRLDRSTLLEIRKVNLDEKNIYFWKRIKYSLKRNYFLYNFSLFIYRNLIKVREFLNLILSRFVSFSHSYRIDYGVPIQESDSSLKS